MLEGDKNICEECPFGESDRGVFRCRIRDLVIDDPVSMCCINAPRHNPAAIDIPVGPVYERHRFPYLVHHDAPEGFLEEKLALLERIVSGDLPARSRYFERFVIDDIGDARAIEAIPLLVDLATAPPGTMEVVGPLDERPEVADLGDQFATDAVLVEVLRFAAVRALQAMRGVIRDGERWFADNEFYYRTEADEAGDLWLHLGTAHFYQVTTGTHLP